MKKADLEAIANALNQAGVLFIVVGGIAVIEHGYGRNTYDVDIVLHLRDDLVREASPRWHTLVTILVCQSPLNSLPIPGCADN